MATDNEKIIVAELSDRELFIPVYLSFLHSKRLNGKEKLLYIVLKSFLNVGKREGEVFPTLETICDMVTMSRPTVINILKSLKKKGILKIEQRGLNRSNVYFLYDYRTLWKDNKHEKDSELENQRKEQEAIDFLKSRGYQFVSKEKGLVSDIGQDADTSSLSYNLSKDNNNTDAETNQGAIAERYPLDHLRSNLYYDDMLTQNQYDRDMIDTFFHYLYEAMNTTKPTIRVNGESKPKETVISVLSKLEYFDFLYAVDKYRENTSKVNNQGAYILTLLYNAKSQSKADITNQVRHDLYGQD